MMIVRLIMLLLLALGIGAMAWGGLLALVHENYVMAALMFAPGLGIGAILAWEGFKRASRLRS